MADTKISALGDIVTLAGGDKVPVADASDLTVTKSATMDEVVTYTKDKTGVTGILKGNGTAISAATSRTDYGEPTTALATGILKNTTTTGQHTIAVNTDLPVGTATQSGAMPTPPNNTTTFLRGDATFASPAPAVTSTSGVGATPTATGTVTITHNLGRTPVIIRIWGKSGFTANAAATPTTSSDGIWDSSGNRCIYQGVNGTTGIAAASSTTFALFMDTSVSNNISGIIQNVGATTFDIAFTETGTHTRGVYLWEAQ
jgi:hypothetical protein